MVVISTVVTTSVAIALNNARATNIATQGLQAEMVAQSGAENALLRLLRDPNYTGEILSMDDGTATISVVSNTITSVGKTTTAEHTTQVDFTYNDNILTVTSWSDVF
ncbi:hypothetical protein KC726_02780 [Candidatus Woesebacteria bacterium]|nr:hypothetical protein [Candidatus Woesebacteria bacterium]